MHVSWFPLACSGQRFSPQLSKDSGFPQQQGSVSVKGQLRWFLPIKFRSLGYIRCIIDLYPGVFYKFPPEAIQGGRQEVKTTTVILTMPSMFLQYKTHDAT